MRRRCRPLSTPTLTTTRPPQRRRYRAGQPEAGADHLLEIARTGMERRWRTQALLALFDALGQRRR